MLALIATVFVVGAGLAVLFGERETALVLVGVAVAADTFALLRAAWKG